MHLDGGRGREFPGLIPSSFSDVRLLTCFADFGLDPGNYRLNISSIPSDYSLVALEIQKVNVRGVAAALGFVHGKISVREGLR